MLSDACGLLLKGGGGARRRANAFDFCIGACLMLSLAPSTSADSADQCSLGITSIHQGVVNATGVATTSTKSSSGDRSSHAVDWNGEPLGEVVQAVLTDGVVCKTYRVLAVLAEFEVATGDGRRYRTTELPVQSLSTPRPTASTTTMMSQLMRLVNEPFPSR